MSAAASPGKAGLAPSAKTELREIERLLRARRLAEAENRAEALVVMHPADADVLAMRGRIAQSIGDMIEADAYVERAFEIAPDRADVRMMRVAAHLYCGRIAEARMLALTVPQLDAPELIVRRTRLLSELNLHSKAYDVARVAAGNRPDDVSLLAALAGAAAALGHMEEAEAIADRLLAGGRMIGEIAYTRATLRKQTDAANHLVQLEDAAKRAGVAIDPALCYAIGKEREDLGQHELAFDWYKKGAEARRRRLSYRVETDQETMNALECTFEREWFERVRPGSCAGTPVFVLGLPRTGTTLVERILSSHSRVGSVGEVNDFAYAVTRHGRTRDKTSLIGAAALADMDVLGQEYWRALTGYGETGSLLIDKTPVNFLYVGLIAKAMPNARIIHLTRNPMAAGYAMFKTYFRMGYPFSYDQQDIGRYMGAYARLMRHWREHLGDRILDVAYEDVVADIEGQARRMLAFCGLEWEAQCVAFYENTLPSTTASAAQVRQPLYSSSLEQWRRHEPRLETLARTLQQEGII